MNTFLDRQTINHTHIEGLIYSKVMYRPSKEEFANFVSTILDVTISYNDSMDSWFFKIQPGFDQKIVLEKTKEYAFDYCENVKSKKRSVEKFRKGNCPQTSIDLPEIPIYGELGGRLIR